MTALALAEEANVEHTEALLGTARTLREEAHRLEQLAMSLRQTASQIENSMVGTDVRLIRGREIITQLGELVDVGEEIHYREASDRLTANGFRPAGVAPEATLLAALHRSDEFVAIAPRTGIYRRVA